MEPFSITCTTCQAKLKVRSAAAIGQILSCPKCESMVQVSPPPGWSADGAASLGAEPGDAQSPHATTARSASSPGGASPPNSSIPASGSPASGPPPHPAASETGPSADTIGSFENISALTEGGLRPSPPPVELAPLSASWASPTETLWRKVALYTVAGGTALLLIGIALGYFISGRGEPAPSEALADGAADPAASTPAAETESNSENQRLDEAPAVVQESNPLTSDPKAARSILPAAERADPEPIANHVAAAIDTPEPTLTPPTASTVEPGAAQSSPEPMPTEKLDATRLLADASLDSLLPEEAPSPDAALVAPAAEMTEAELLAAAEAESVANEASVSDGLTPAAASESALGVRRVPVDSSTPLRPGEEILRWKLPHISYRALPLKVLLAEISELSTLPVTFDLAALAAAQVSPEAKVSLAVSDKTLAEILAQALASQKLTYQTEGRQIIITTPAAIAAARSARFSVEDLAKDEDQLRELAALIVKTVAPQSWEFAGGPGKIDLDGTRLAIVQPAPIVHEAVVFCERLRLARGLPTRSRLPADQLQLESARKRASSRLARPVAGVFHAPTRLTYVVEALATAAGVKTFFDWPSLERAHFSPTDAITCALAEQPLGDALEALLSPLGLAYRVVDAETLEIFSQDDLPNKMTREFYSLAPLLASGVQLDVLLQGIRQLTGEAAWEPETSALLYFDPASQHLIVRQGNKAHGQIERLLDELLRKLSAKKPAGKE